MMDYDPKVWLLFQQECKWWVSNVQQTQQQHKVNLLEQKKLHIEATIWHSSWPFIMTQEQAPFIKFTFPHISNQNCYSTLKSIFLPCVIWSSSSCLSSSSKTKIDPNICLNFCTQNPGTVQLEEVLLWGRRKPWH